MPCNVLGRFSPAEPGNQAKRFDLLQLFVLHVDGDARIEDITACRDGAHINRELGRVEVDCQRGIIFGVC
jgi:hypothetical protein